MKNELDRIAKDTNFFLNKFIKRQNNSKLIPAMRYGLFPGGKKFDLKY
jgi:farnesyl diphosphate synthase